MACKYMTITCCHMHDKPLHAPQDANGERFKKLWFHSFAYDSIYNIIPMISYLWYCIWYHRKNYDIKGNNDIIIAQGPRWTLAVTSLHPIYDCTHFWTIHLHARAQANVCTLELKRWLYKATPLQGIWKYLLAKSKQFEQKRTGSKFGWVAKCASHHSEGMRCFASHSVWRFYSEWFFIFRMFPPIQYLLHITIRPINAEIQITLSPLRPTEVNSLNR